MVAADDELLHLIFSVDCLLHTLLVSNRVIQRIYPLLGSPLRTTRFMTTASIFEGKAAVVSGSLDEVPIKTG